ncbi:hypothetical protein [Acuticoccus mangrovi]|uniref:Uncharacterized protein n=1 Tax=Acuticoccus mangrovi TaxID=2796142 RepID=A0A934IMD2_9HYPH|nr:hypothetical protein [Acuticoccus mangrovi]MBJ3777571.1 hypothetical protein [Acuticoccus mangrovi]
MDFEQLFANFQYNDLQWFIPVMAGLVIIVGGLLIGIIRGMTAGVIVALFFGGLMSMSPVLLNALQRQANPVNAVSADVARGAAELSVLNHDVVTELSRVVATMRSTLAGLAPIVTPAEGEDDNGVAERFNQSLADTEERLDAAISSLSRANLLRTRLEEDVQTLEVEMRRAPQR